MIGKSAERLRRKAMVSKRIYRMTDRLHHRTLCGNAAGLIFCTPIGIYGGSYEKIILGL